MQRCIRHLHFWLFLSAFILFSSATSIAQDETIAQLIDNYIDLRYEGDEEATNNLLRKLESHGLVAIEQLEMALRQPRHQYPDVDSSQVGKITKHAIECQHVDYASKYLMYVPSNYSHDTPAPLVIVGHGGNSSMSAARALSTAQAYINAYAKPLGDGLGAIVVAPASERGWGQIGNSLIFSTVSKVQRQFNIDADKIYITGQSMGGHLSYRSALSLPDRFAAVSPQSGGYDFVAKKSIGNLINVPGYAIWGSTEPYGINKDNRVNESWASSKWATENSMDWVFVEREGGHFIYQDELPKVADFFEERPRDLYRKHVYLRSGGSMKFVKTWGVKGWPEHKVYHETKPLRWNMRHWLEVSPRPDSKAPLTILATYVGDNQFALTSENVRKASLFLHSKMVDLEKPIIVHANGEKVFEGKVARNPALMFELAREFDDRGRVFHAKLELNIETDQAIELTELP